MALFSGNKDNSRVFHQAFGVTGIVLLCLLFTGVFIYTFKISLLLMAGVVLAVYLRMLTDKLKKWTGWKDMLCYVMSLLFTLMLLTGLFMLVGNTVQDQAKKLVKQIPEMKNKIGTQLESSPMLKKFLGKYTTGWKQEEQPDADKKDSTSSRASGQRPPENAREADDTSANTPGNQNDTALSQPADTTTSGSVAGPQPSGGSSSGGLSSIIANFFSSTFGLLGDLYAIFFLGVFLAASPQTYTKGFISLLPAQSREKGETIIDRLSTSLRKWFKGTVYSVLITFALTATGLLIMGVDLWLVLAIIAGLMTFVPNFGPIIALIPALMVGLSQGAQQALWIFILYFFVQLVESNIITPAIQKKMLDTPAALLLFFQMVMGALAGGWAVVLATPILVILMVLVDELYVQKIK